MSDLNNNHTTESQPYLSAWWKGTAFGILLAIPLGALLSYGAALMAFLGLFFFMLFGLAIGAGMYRFGQKSRPVPPWARRTSVLLVAAVTWSISLWVEARDFPNDVSKMTLKSYVKRPENLGPDDIKALAANYAIQHLEENYPPGGALGYFQWIATSNGISIQPDGLPRQPYLNRFPYMRTIWLIRIALSALLLTYAINSIVRPLSKPIDVDDEEEEEEEEEDNPSTDSQT